MLNKKIKVFTIHVLIFAIAATPMHSLFAKPKNNKVRVVFAGIQFENIAPELQERLTSRVISLLQNETRIELIDDRSVATGGHQFNSTPSAKEAVFEYATKKRADYVFLGEISGQDRNGKKLLVGELRRYDSQTSDVHQFEIIKYHHDLDPSLSVFEREFVKTILPESNSKRRLLPALVLGGVAVAGVLAMTLSFTTANATGGGKGGGGETP